jgi:ATP-dependent DNA helicase RecQ
LTALRRDEQRQMQEYVDLRDGHMKFLIRALDGDPGEADAPDLPLLTTEADPMLVREAIAFLRRTSLPIDARKKWPDLGGLPQYGLTGRIAPELRSQPGKALCVWGDAGWGSLVRQGKYHDGRFSDDLVGAVVTMLCGWNPQPAPAWVTCIPSLRYPKLVPDFARRLAAALGLPFHAVLRKTDNRPEQKTMANSTQQARNIDGSLALTIEALPVGPVLLIDDMVDSRWTLTVAAWLLRSHGSDVVFPLALSRLGHDE